MHIFVIVYTECIHLLLTGTQEDLNLLVTEPAVLDDTVMEDIASSLIYYIHWWIALPETMTM